MGSQKFGEVAIWLVCLIVAITLTCVVEENLVQTGIICPVEDRDDGLWGIFPFKTGPC